MDIRGQYADLLDDVKRSVCEVIDSGRFILGPNMRALEEEVAAATGACHAVAVANGTDALVLSLEALGIGTGDEVITTAYTFYATAEAIARVGATPVFADIDPGTFNLDPAAAEAAVDGAHARHRGRARVRRAGRHAGPARGGEPPRAGRDRGRRPGFGAALDGRSAGSFGDLATFSFFPTKNFPAFGDAGMVVSGSADLAERVRLLRFHGSREKRRFELVGTNSRMDEIQAAVLRRFLPEVAGWNAARRAAADRYRVLGLGDLVELPAEAPGAEHVYHLYVVRAPARDELARALSAAGIGCGAYYDIPLHLQPVFAQLGYRRGDLPETERAADEGLALPMFPTLDEAAADRGRRGGACGGAGRGVVRPRRVWIDLTNSPHAVDLRPARAAVAGPWRRRVGDRAGLRADARAARAVRHRAHRDRPPRRGGSRAGKARAAGDRVRAMVRFGRRGRFDVAIAHGSTDLPMACRLLPRPQHDDVRLRVRDPPALAQLPPREPGARARRHPAGAAAPFRRPPRLAWCATQA